MRCLSILFSFAFLYTYLALALPRDITLSNPVVPRQSCLDTCGQICYYSRTVSAAQNKGYSLYSANDNISSYPHVFYNREGFQFPIIGPHYEYPILRTFKVYTGGDPGQDRVIFNGTNHYGGLITHEAARTSGGFNECI